jgi:hypothetical protein
MLRRLLDVVRGGTVDAKPKTIVRVDDAGVRCEGAAPWSLRWAELERVILRTTDRGPFEDDVFWLLQSADGTHFVPQGTPGETELLERLQQLPGFDNRAVIAAMGSAENQPWTCWERGTQDASPA